MKTLIRNVKLFDGTALAPRPMDVLFDESGILAVKAVSLYTSDAADE